MAQQVSRTNGDHSDRIGRNVRNLNPGKTSRCIVRRTRNASKYALYFREFFSVFRLLLGALWTVSLGLSLSFGERGLGG